MVATVFSDIINKGLIAGRLPAKTKQSREWYRNTAAKIKSLNEKSFFKGDPSRLVSKPILGSMYMFFYFPKTHEDLPFYDTFPLIFPFAKAEGGFLGLNMHYLPPQLRAKLMDGLYEFANNKKYTEKTKLAMNYQLLKRASKLFYYEACVKRYLYSQVRSKFMYIQPNEWDIALFLPTERFVKQNKQIVWSDSKRKIRRY